MRLIHPSSEIVEFDLSMETVILPGAHAEPVFSIWDLAGIKETLAKEGLNGIRVSDEWFLFSDIMKAVGRW